VASSHGLSSDDHDDAGAAPILLLAGRGCNAAHAGARRLVLACGAKYRTVAVTDRAIVMCCSSMWRAYKTIGPDKVHIHRRFQDDLRQADAAIGVIW